MFFSSLSAVRSPAMKATDRFGWYPEGDGGEIQSERDRRIAQSWLSEQLDPQAWAQCKRLLDRSYKTSVPEFFCNLCRWDASELVELLYPRRPDLFLTSQTYTLPNQLFFEHIQTPFSTEELQRYVYAQTGQLSVVCLCAICGAVSCLEALLEQGADPNGLECPEGWSYIKLDQERIMPVTPMDCARLANQKDCQLVLEMFGGKGLHELLLE